MIIPAEMAVTTVEYVNNIPNMSAYEMGYDLGFGLEKVGEFALTRNAGVFGVNVAKFGLGEAAFHSSLIGGKSYLFGRGRLGSFGGKANGIFNRRSKRFGWSYHEGVNYMQYRNGPTRGAYHYKPWFVYKP